MLLVVNGPPGGGKSTVARRWADDHPRSLVVEIDDLRTRLGGWRADDETRLLARELAVDLVRGHLQRGYDVVVPQYLGRPEFLARLQELAADVGVTFVEVVLTAPAELVGARFRDRRVASAGIEHPESDLPDAAVGAAIDDAVARLSEGAEGRTRIVIDASGDPASTYDELVRALADPT